MLAQGPLLSYPLLAPPMPSGGAQPVPHYFSDRPYTTEPDDTPANLFWEPRLKAALRLDRSLPLSPLDQRRTVMQVGAIVLVNTDGKLDHLMMDLPMDGRAVEVLAGRPGFRMADFVTLFKGTATGWAGDGGDLTAPLRDGSWELDAPSQSLLYGGTGGLDGGPDLTGKPWPQLWGMARHFQPVLVDEDRLIWQFHWRRSKEVLEFCDGGIPLTFAGYVTDIEAATPEIGQYVVELERSYARTGSPPNRIPTMTARGDCKGGRYVSSTDAIMFRLLHDGLNWDDARFDLAAFARARLQQPGEVGFYTGLEDTTFADLVDTLSIGPGFAWGVDPVGKFGLSRPDVAAVTASRYFDKRHIKSVERVQAPETVFPPFWSVKLGYQKRWQDLAGNYGSGIDAAHRAFLSQPYRYPNPARDPLVKSRHLQAQQLVLNTLFDSLDVTVAEQQRVLNWVKRDANLAKVTFWAHAYRVTPGMTVNITHDGLGLNDGKNCFVYRQGIDAAARESFIYVRYE
jgi:hypothetical protein